MDNNTQAVGYLLKGDVGRCILTLKEELARVGAACTSKDLADAIARSANQNNGMAMEPEKMSPQVYSVTITAHPIWECDGNLFSFYPRAFVLKDPHHQRCKTRSPVVLMYNLGLAYQLAAGSFRIHGQTEACVRTLQSSLMLYKRALEFAKVSWDQEDLIQLRCLLMAILNNMGYISSHQMDFHGSQSCIKMLCEILKHETKSGHPALPVENYEHFIESMITFLNVSDLVLAPAA